MLISKVSKTIWVILLGIISSLLASLIWGKISSANNSERILHKLKEHKTKEKSIRQENEDSDIKCITELFNNCNGKIYTAVIDSKNDSIIKKYSNNLVNYLNKNNHNTYLIENNMLPTESNSNTGSNLNNLLLIYLKRISIQPTDNVELDDNIDSSGMFSANIEVEFKLYNSRDSLITNCSIQYSGADHTESLAEKKAFTDILLLIKSKK
ncbi:hypothetical protein [Kordia sp.]|uniref:hypothetical protein n=1 Tax=Kordia sp. TaxID=1965332 RepID=UPI003D6B51E4